MVNNTFLKVLLGYELKPLTGDRKPDRQVSVESRRLLPALLFTDPEPGADGLGGYASRCMPGQALNCF